MMHVGDIAREMRESLGMTQQELATTLGITSVHVSNIENDKSFPSRQLIDRYREAVGVDLYILAWCRHGDHSGLPDSIRKPADELARAYQLRLDKLISARRKTAG